MSSHHFVKEGQEPALLILDALSLELAEPLLEWAPLVIVTDVALPSVLRWGIKIDVVLIHVGRVQEMKLELVNQFPIEIVTYCDPADLTSLALDFLIEKKQKAVNVMTEASESLFEIINRFTQKIQIDVFDQKINWLCISTGRYEKWLPAKSQLKIRVDEKQSLACVGLLHRQEHWEVEKDGMIIIQSAQFFWVGELSE